MKKTTKIPPSIDRCDVWRVLRAKGLHDLAAHALSAGADGEAYWASPRSEHTIAREALAFGTIGTAEVVARACALAARADKAAASLPSEGSPARLAALRDALDAAEVFPSVRWAVRASLELALGREEEARFAALESLALIAADGDSSWAPRPAELTRHVPAGELLEVLVDEPIDGAIAVRWRDGRDELPAPALVLAALDDHAVELPAPALVLAALDDHAVELTGYFRSTSAVSADGRLYQPGEPFRASPEQRAHLEETTGDRLVPVTSPRAILTGETIFRDGDRFIVHRPPLTSPEAWGPVLARFVEVRVGDGGIAYRVTGGPQPDATERRAFVAALEDLVGERAATSDPATRASWRAWSRRWIDMLPGLDAGPDGWRVVMPAGRAGRDLAQMWGAA